MKEKYRKQVELLIDALPIVMADERVALKGGTAINLFHRDLPRLSVDIDLCYLPVEDRATTFKNIHVILKKIREELESKLGLSVRANHSLDGKKEAKLVATRSGTEIKIEPNYTLRGSLFDPIILDLSTKTQKEFSRQLKVKCLSLADTFGGKICAALDRQHPRDLFDVKMLLEKEGITSDIKDAFLFYLLSHNRPVDELLDPNEKDIASAYDNEFKEMAKIDVPLENLIAARSDLVKSVLASITDDEKKFLVSFVENEPKWDLFKHSKIQDFPSIKWKMYNQSKMTEKKREEYTKKVKSVLKY